MSPCSLGICEEASIMGVNCAGALPILRAGASGAGKRNVFCW